MVIVSKCLILIAISTLVAASPALVQLANVDYQATISSGVSTVVPFINADSKVAGSTTGSGQCSSASSSVEVPASVDVSASIAGCGQAVQSVSSSLASLVETNASASAQSNVQANAAATGSLNTNATDSGLNLGVAVISGFW